jgi:hypothetical protein
MNLPWIIKTKKHFDKFDLLLILSHMKTVTLRAFKHHSRFQRMAHDGQPVLVTHRGQPYFRALPPEKTGTFLGAARGGKPLTAKALESVLPENEWRSAR